jgi:hypothetical protein
MLDFKIFKFEIHLSSVTHPETKDTCYISKFEIFEQFVAQQFKIQNDTPQPSDKVEIKGNFHRI